MPRKINNLPCDVVVEHMVLGFLQMRVDNTATAFSLLNYYVTNVHAGLLSVCRTKYPRCKRWKAVKHDPRIKQKGMTSELTGYMRLFCLKLDVSEAAYAYLTLGHAKVLVTIKDASLLASAATYVATNKLTPAQTTKYVDSICAKEERSLFHQACEDMAKACKSTKAVSELTSIEVTKCPPRVLEAIRLGKDELRKQLAFAEALGDEPIGNDGVSEATLNKAVSAFNGKEGINEPHAQGSTAGDTGGVSRASRRKDRTAAAAA